MRIVIADDGTQSYVIAHYDLIGTPPVASDTFLVGSPTTNTLWRYQRATFVGWDKDTALVLLAVPHLRIRLSPARPAFRRASPSRQITGPIPPDASACGCQQLGTPVLAELGRRLRLERELAGEGRPQVR